MKNRGLKIIALLLCIAMTAALFAACGSDSNKGGDEINYDIDLTQKPKLNVLMPNSGKPIEAVNSNSNALLIQQLTGYEVEYTQLPAADSPPGSPIPGILQARTLEWVAISFSNA